MAKKGFQLAYGSTVNLFTDREGNDLGYGPEAAELVGLPDTDDPQMLGRPASRRSVAWCIPCRR